MLVPDASTGQLGQGRYTFELNLAGTAGVPDRGRCNVTGSATLTRSDGATMRGRMQGRGTMQGATCSGVTTYEVTLTHGSRDLIGANLTLTSTGSHYVSLTPSGSAYTESWSFTGESSAVARVGYWMLGVTGSVDAFGGVAQLGNAPTRTATHIEPTPTRNGYWIADTTGHVFGFGDAHWYGNANPKALAPGELITSLSATPDGDGYWLFTDRGRALSFGDAERFGDLHTLTLNARIVGSVATPTGHGYYLIAEDGGVFTFGDAKFRGSMGATHLNQPVVGMVPTADNRGYWLVAADGGVFTFHAPFRGSVGNIRLNRPVIGMVRYGTGYYLVAQDGGIFNFSSRPFFGSLGASPPAKPITGAAAAG